MYNGGMKLLQQSQIDGVVSELDSGAVVAVPTETIYGLAVKYDDAMAIDKLMRIKNRAAGSGKIFSLMLADVDAISQFATIDGEAQRIAGQYLPGELTLVLPKNPDFHNPYFDQFDTVGVRVPDHPWLRRLIEKAGPLIVTSANLRDETPAVDSDEVQRNLTGIDVLVAGRAGGHAPSTVAEVRDGQVAILRQGDLVLT
jgi:L-threonylcarbamoyladenylate synthase